MRSYSTTGAAGTSVPVMRRKSLAGSTLRSHATAATPSDISMPTRTSTSIRRTHSDTESNKKNPKSFPSKQRKMIRKNAKKFVNNFGFRLNRENSSPTFDQAAEGSIFLAGELFKKRQGLTGLQAKVKARFKNEEENLVKKLWPLRYVELKNSVLSYYKVKEFQTSNGHIERMVNPTARGSIDLKRAGLMLKLSYPSAYQKEKELGPQHVEGDDLYPTEFQFDLVYNHILRPTEWVTYTFCCQDEKQFYTWLMAISHEIFSRPSINSISLPSSKTLVRGPHSQSFTIGQNSMKLSNDDFNLKTRIPVIDLNRFMMNQESIAQVGSNLSPIAVDRARCNTAMVSTNLSPLGGSDRERNLSSNSATLRGWSGIDFDNDESIITDAESDDNADTASSFSNATGDKEKLKKRRFPFARKRRVDFNMNLKKLNSAPLPGPLVLRSGSETFQKDFEPEEQEDEIKKKYEEMAMRLFLEVVGYVVFSQVIAVFLAWRGVTLDAVVVSVCAMNAFLFRSLYFTLGLQPQKLSPILKRMLITIKQEAFKPPQEAIVDAETVEHRKESGTSTSLDDKTQNTVVKVSKLHVKQEISVDLDAMGIGMSEFDPFNYDFLKGMEHLPQDESKGKPQTWQYADHRFVNFRIGPNYKANKKKAPSNSSSFIPVALDLYSSPDGNKMEKVMKRINFPFHLVNPRCADIPENLGGKVPDLLVVNYQIAGGSMFKTSNDSVRSFIQFFTPSNLFISEINEICQNDNICTRDDLNAPRLLLKWLREAETDPKLKHRLKLFAYVRNLKESNLPGWLQKFNGKPCMVTKSCKMSRGSAVDPKSNRTMHWLELDIDVGCWGMMVRRGISVIVPNMLKNLHWSVSLVIQGETDDELPERAMNAMEFYKVDTKELTTWPYPAV